MVVMTTNIYHNMSDVNTTVNTEIVWKELEETQRKVKAHSRDLTRILRLGHDLMNRNKVHCMSRSELRESRARKVVAL